MDENEYRILLGCSTQYATIRGNLLLVYNHFIQAEAAELVILDLEC